MDLNLAVIASPVILGLAVLATGVVRRALLRWRILDHPNERSSHAQPTPRGGGIAVIGVLVISWAALALIDEGEPGEIWWLLAAATSLAALSWTDDLRALHPAPRLLAQAVAVGLGVTLLSGPQPVFQGLLPPWLDAVAAGLAWLWFVNLFNFMDGIDGIAGSEAASIGIGLFVLSALGGLAPSLGALGLAAAAAAAGFLAWNWRPARVFLGDVGSVPLGFLLGWLLLLTAAHGAWHAALILPLYYLADATLTLARRLIGGKKVWRAHREHFYQRAVRAGRDHVQVVRIILAGNAVLVALALAAMAGWGWPALIAALAWVALILICLSRPRQRADS